MLQVYSYFPCNEVLLCADMNCQQEEQIGDDKLFKVISPSLIQTHAQILLRFFCITCHEMPGFTQPADAIFMTLLLFHHSNSFESIYQSSVTIRHIALKIMSGSFHQFTVVHKYRARSQAMRAIILPWLSKHSFLVI